MSQMPAVEHRYSRLDLLRSIITDPCEEWIEVTWDRNGCYIAENAWDEYLAYCRMDAKSGLVGMMGLPGRVTPAVDLNHHAWLWSEEARWWRDLPPLLQQLPPSKAYRCWVRDQGRPDLTTTRIPGFARIERRTATEFNPREKVAALFDRPYVYEVLGEREILCPEEIRFRFRRGVYTLQMDAKHPEGCILQGKVGESTYDLDAQRIIPTEQAAEMHNDLAMILMVLDLLRTA